VAFLVGMIQLLFDARPMSSVAGILLVGFFVVMTGASPSAVQAGIMISIQLLAPIFRRENDGPTSLMAALALILLVNPFSCASISLQMSFSAMAGMVLLAGPLTRSILAAFGLPELKQAELDLIENHYLPDTELLIVGHHGSRTSTDDLFLETIRAEDAVISVGSNNSYGHPNREVLARLQAHGCNIWRTDRNGTVEIRVKQ